ncbi:MAG: hypothetical protein RLZZ305_785 [Actinomycetota bacterium]|jgi:ribonuclease E
MDNDGSPNGADASPSSTTPRTDGPSASPQSGQPGQGGPRKRRRGSRGGKNHKKPQSEQLRDGSTNDRNPQELPDPPAEGRISDPAVAERALVRKPQIGDTRPAPVKPPDTGQTTDGQKQSGQKQGKRRRGGRGRSRQGGGDGGGSPRQGRSQEEIEAEIIERRRGRERDGRPLGRYLMCVQVREGVTQVAVLEGRALIEHYVSRPADDISQIHGNIYLGRVQNVLPGMEAAFVDIATPKNAVLYRGDVQYDKEDLDTPAGEARIENILRAKQNIVCQVTKNPIGAKGARLTQEVSLPGRFVVLVPNSKTYGISKRLPDAERRRLRSVLDRVKPAEHGVIVRTAAEHATEHELRADMLRLLDEWQKVEDAAKAASGPALLHREPDMAVRVIREEFNADYRGVIIDDHELFEEVRAYVADFNPELADRVTYYDREAEGLSLFEQQHVHEQVHKALDRKVWLPSGGSLIIEHTEALTVIDVNTGKNVGKNNLEDTVFQNNLEAADEIARQLRLRDIGGIIVIDFIDMEIKDNRRKVVDSFRQALSRDKTRTQVFEISELGLVEMTRKRIGEGLLTEFAERCPDCEGRGVRVDFGLLD